MTTIRRPGPRVDRAPQARGFYDTHKVSIRSTDHVMVTSWGEGARLVDTGTKSRIVRFGRTRVVIIDADDQERAVHPTNLSVLRRDGADGFEGNRSSPSIGTVGSGG